MQAVLSVLLLILSLDSTVPDVSLLTTARDLHTRHERYRPGPR